MAAGAAPQGLTAGQKNRMILSDKEHFWNPDDQSI